MAVTIVRNELIGNHRYVEIYMTAVAAATEAEIPRAGGRLTVRRFIAALISGTATVLSNPSLGRIAGFAAGSFDELGSDIVGAPAVRVGTTEPLKIKLADNGSLFVQPRPDAGADNVVRVEMILQQGWED